VLHGVYACAQCPLQHTATQYNSLQHTQIHSNTLQHTRHVPQNTCGHNPLQHTATHCNSLQLSQTHCCNTLDIYRRIRVDRARCNSLQLAATHCNTLHHAYIQETCGHYPPAKGYVRAVNLAGCGWHFVPSGPEGKDITISFVSVHGVPFLYASCLRYENVHVVGMM